MRILQIMGTLDRGGVESMMANLIRNGFKTDICLEIPDKGAMEEELKKYRCQIYHLTRRSTSMAKHHRELAEIARNYDIVHIHGNSSTMLIELIPAVLAHIPVRMVHSHNTTCSHLWLHRLLLPVFNKCYTEGLACGYDAGKWLYGEKPFFELKNGIDLQNYKYNEEVRKVYRKKINAEEKIVIGHVGNFIEQKDFW